MRKNLCSFATCEAQQLLLSKTDVGAITFDICVDAVLATEVIGIVPRKGHGGALESGGLASTMSVAFVTVVLQLLSDFNPCGKDSNMPHCKRMRAGRIYTAYFGSLMSCEYLLMTSHH